MTLPPPVHVGRATRPETPAPDFTFHPADKAGRKARLSIQGQSGSGKTWTGLSICHGLSEGRKFAVIDTESGAASLYAGVGGVEFDTVSMDRYDPRDLIRVLDSAAQAAYPTVFVDSLSHFWKGTDGTLEQVDRASSRYGGNKFAGWKDGTPIQNDMVAALLAYPGHVVASMRSYTEWVLENGKPKQVGTRPEQRKGIEYEFDVAVAMDIDNTLEVLKSRCPELNRKVIKRPQGARDVAGPLLAWLNASPGPTPTPPTAQPDA
ncbi:AAA family ATPase [Streptomyces albidoflavus]|uniref:ATP-binding protein n=1 Tax=Streptomyces albidoflavus TaxID=1886 RepID=UPI000BAE39A4|nr:ATP-binding protein [Streptomyces albidoflavus]PAX84681.1 AAA family ATPase [Streptomyces albidoflavus]PBO25101.1 AAA family ATPase [Streptomyces albidoflavus]PBO29777.1 AAA family ATPase [Streptomyces albidoflavus]